MDVTCKYQNSEIYTGSFFLMQVRTQTEHSDVTCDQSGRNVSQKFASRWCNMHRISPNIRRLLIYCCSLSPIGEFGEKTRNKVEIQIHTVNYAKARLLPQLILEYSQDYQM